MKGWFGPRPGTNAGYSGVWMTYNVTPVSWQGWLATVIYFAVQVTAVVIAYKLATRLQWAPLIAIAPIIPLHLAYLWFASRHYVTYNEMDPSVLPSDLRPESLRCDRQNVLR